MALNAAFIIACGRTDKEKKNDRYEMYKFHRPDCLHSRQCELCQGRF
jgi:hypothetical protein